MSDASTILANLSLEDLESVTEAMEGQRVSLESSRAAIANVAGGEAEGILLAFQQLRAEGFTTAQAVTVLRGILAARKTEIGKRTIADLVISGPDVPGIPTGSTEAVVQTLFQEAKTEIIAAGYAFHKAQGILERLAKRMTENSELKVVLHVDVSRGYRDTSTNEAILARFALEFRRKHWPWEPKPEIFYDPRGLATESGERACLHAKVVIVDRVKLLVTSANFTEAAQKRNIETGVLIESCQRASQLADYFESLRMRSVLQRLYW